MSHIKLDQKRIFLTYNDSENKLIGPMILLSKLVENFEQWEVIYGTAGRETAPTTGQNHYHVILILKETCRRRNAEDLVTIEGIRPHLEKVTRGTKTIIQYCQKDGNFAESGKNPCKEVIDKKEKNRMLLEGNLEELYNNGEIGPIDVIRADKLRGIFAKNAKPERYKKKLILWFTGETGEGKTRMAIDIAEKYFENNYWLSNDSLRWFDGYNNQKVAILDDFRKSMLTDWNFLLRLLDGYNLIVQVKCGFARWNPELIVVTSPATPHEAFSWVNKEGEEKAWDKEEQLIRRITYEDELQVYSFPLWDTEQKRLESTIRSFLGLAPIVEEEWSVIEPEGFITPG